MFVCGFAAKKYIENVYKYKNDKDFLGIEIVVKVIEVILILAGLYVFVFQTNSICARYGVYNSQLGMDSNLAYYHVEEIPNILDYLVNQNMSGLDKS